MFAEFRLLQGLFYVSLECGRDFTGTVSLMPLINTECYAHTEPLRQVTKFFIQELARING